MSDQPHPVGSDELQSYANNSLDDARRALVEAHLGRCADCADDVTAWKAVGDAVHDVGLDAARDQRVLAGLLARMQDEDQSASPSDRIDSPPRVQQPTPWYARNLSRVAAAVVIVVGVVLTLTPSGQPAYADVLARAAADFEQAGTASLRIDGSATVALGAGTREEADDAALALTVAIAGDGEVAVPDSSHTRVTVTSDKAAGLGSAQTREIIRIGQSVYTRGDGKGWIRGTDDDGPGFLSRAMLSPDLPALLRSAVSTPHDHGVEDVAGVSARHLSFDIDAATMGTTDAFDLSYRAHVWIDDDDRLRQIRVDAEGQGTQPAPGYWLITLTTTLSGIGETVDIRPPPVATDS